MDHLRKAFEAKKAAILADAQRKIAEMEAEWQELARLTNKYDLVITTGDSITLLEVKAYEAPRGQGESIAARSKREAAAYIREAMRPVMLGELFDALSDRGAVSTSKNAKNALSATLGQSGDFVSIPGRGWWFANESPPGDALWGAPDRRQRIRDVTNAEASDDSPSPDASDVAVTEPQVMQAPKVGPTGGPSPATSTDGGHDGPATVDK